MFQWRFPLDWRAMRLVVDTGLHALGGTRQQAIDYMLAHTIANANDAASEIDRYIIWPGQATSSMLGRLEILAAREHPRKAGAAFDIKAFDDRVLEDGSMPLTFLREMIYPVAMRATGLGCALDVSRVGSIVGPAIGGLMLATMADARAVYRICIVPALVGLACVAVLKWSAAPRRRPAEAI